MIIGVMRNIIQTLARAVGLRWRSRPAEMIRFRPYALR